MDTTAERHERKRSVTSAPAALALLSVALLLSMSVWLSASAVLPALTSVWHVSGAAVGWLSASVQVGFAAGALGSALLGLADRVPPRRLFVLASFAAAACNAAFALWGDDLAAGLVLRLLTGAALAGVYPVAVKLLAGWFPTSRGLAIGIMIAGLTLGSALPHLLRSAGALVPWQVVVGSCSALAVAGGLIVGLFLADGPVPATSHRFRWDALPHVARNRPVMLATLGYFGHNWELYGMWVWLPAFLYESWSRYVAAGQLVGESELATFVVIGVAGAVGALAGGRIADRYGRVRTIMAALAISGLCALVIGWTFQGPPWATLAIASLWGVAVIADSAQLSAAVTELGEPAWMGTALTFQLAAGFLVTAVSINVVPWLQALGGWRWAFCVLSLGPAIGILAMLLLQREPHRSGWRRQATVDNDG